MCAEGAGGGCRTPYGWRFGMRLTETEVFCEVLSLRNAIVQSHSKAEKRVVSRQERNQLSRRAVLGGWILAPACLALSSGCGSETVEVKGGTTAPPTTARAKQAEKAEEEIFKRTKKLR